MSNVETYYLIDFENVNNAGLICSRHLDYHDHIHIDKYGFTEGNKVYRHVKNCLNQKLAQAVSDCRQSPRQMSWIFLVLKH